MPKNPKIKTLNFEILEDHIDEVLKASDEAIYRSLQAVGVEAVGNAKTYITGSGAVDTGLLRNSITFLVGGGSAHIDSYKGDRPSKYKKSKKKPEGSYNGTAPADKKGIFTLYVGTNVKYAPYVELGTVKNKVARPFLRFAMERHIDQYKQIFLKYLNDTE